MSNDTSRVNEALENVAFPQSMLGPVLNLARELERENIRLRHALEEIATQIRLAKTDMDDGGICVLDMADEVERVVRSILPNAD